MPFVSVIVPTLNEARCVGDLLSSLERQDYRDFEVIVVDGGSRDGTLGIANSYGATTVLLPNSREFPSRNHAATLAAGDVLLFTGADVVFPDNLLGRIVRKFERSDLLAVAGPGIPIDAPFLLKLEYSIYNFFRYALARMPRPARRFMSSTNLLAVRRSTFEQLGGFISDVNSDGLLGRALCDRGRVMFSRSEIKAYMSARRMHEMGFIRFNAHFAYMWENFFPSLSGTSLIKRLKRKSGHSHSRMRHPGHGVASGGAGGELETREHAISAE